MAEPSIAGMRVEGEKLSPDGTKVIYLWNAEGKMPRDLYLVSTQRRHADRYLAKQRSPAAQLRTPQPENKLNYGVELRDDFVKARENQLGGFEWSPDSKKACLSHTAAIVYVLTLSAKKTPKRLTKTQPPESGARFLDNERILFSQSGNAFVLNTSDSTLTQITKEANPADIYFGRKHNAEQGRNNDRVCRIGQFEIPVARRTKLPSRICRGKPGPPRMVRTEIICNSGRWQPRHSV